MNVGSWSLARLIAMWLGWVAILGIATIVPALFGVGIALPVPSRWVDAVGVRAILAFGGMLLLAPVIAITVLWGWYRLRH
jgi:hypothetical protein